MSENEIVNCEDLKNLPKLKKLNFNTNKLDKLTELSNFPSLEQLDVGANVITNVNNLSHLAQYKKLTKFNAAGNPFADELADKLKSELLFRLYPGVKIKFVGDDEVVEDDIIAWKAERKERLKAQAEAERLAAEKAARGDEAPAEGEEAPAEDAE